MDLRTLIRSRRAMRTGFSLVEILVVVVILAILAAVLLPHYLGGAKTAAGKTVESPKQRAQSVECINNLRQIRLALQVAGTNDDARPATLADLRTQGVTEEMTRCPVGGEPYAYDPQTGQVHCVHPGHESY